MTRPAGAPAVVRKKLIEASIPRKAINVASAREKSIRHGRHYTFLLCNIAVLFG